MHTHTPATVLRAITTYLSLGFSWAIWTKFIVSLFILPVFSCPQSNISLFPGGLDT